MNVIRSVCCCICPQPEVVNQSRINSEETPLLGSERSSIFARRKVTISRGERVSQALQAMHAWQSAQTTKVPSQSLQKVSVRYQRLIKQVDLITTEEARTVGDSAKKKVQYEFTLSNFRLESLPRIPIDIYHLTWLNVCFNKLIELPPLPETLRYLKCTTNKLTALPLLPRNLECLFCGDNIIEQLPTLPPP